MSEAKQVAYPYLPEGRTIQYVPKADLYMQMARTIAKEQSKDKTMPGAAVIVQNGIVIGMGANGSAYHETHGCERVRRGCKSGEGYDLCEGCSPKNHSEPTAIRDAKSKNHETCGADLYLWGHWWFCKNCWAAMIPAGIKNVFLLEGSEVLFNKEKPGNIVGKQFSAV